MFSAYSDGKILSDMYFAYKAGMLQVYPNMLAVCAGGFEKAWPF